MDIYDGSLCSSVGNAFATGSGSEPMTSMKMHLAKCHFSVEDGGKAQLPVVVEWLDCETRVEISTLSWNSLGDFVLMAQPAYQGFCADTFGRVRKTCGTGLSMEVLCEVLR